MTLRPLPSREEAQARLQQLFPREAFDAVVASPVGATAVAAMIYVDAVVPDGGEVPDGATWARPTTCLWLSDAAYARSGNAERTAWRKAAAVGKRRVGELVRSWGEEFEAWYADNTRETLRDEIFPKWLDFGAVRDRAGIKTTSSLPRWALTSSFADLFDPALDAANLDAAIETWRENHMSPGDRLRIRTNRDRERQSHAVTVSLPDGTVRSLEPGEASWILKGVIESWAPARLADPLVLSISEPGAKAYLAGKATLSAVGLAINVSTLLPDALVVDLGTKPRVTFWIVEAVATDGPIDEDRRRAFLRWAEDQRIPLDSCRFLSAFGSRNSASARRRLKDLAVNTYAWYADEPLRELAWYEIGAQEGHDHGDQ